MKPPPRAYRPARSDRITLNSSRTTGMAKLGQGTGKAIGTSVAKGVNVFSGARSRNSSLTNVPT